jgi:hypothetical protein
VHFPKLVYVNIRQVLTSVITLIFHIVCLVGMHMASYLNVGARLTEGLKGILADSIHLSCKST